MERIGGLIGEPVQKLLLEVRQAGADKRRFISAADHLSRAAVTYHYAKYLFVQDMDQMRLAHQRAVECLDLALPYLDPPGERVLIPYEGKQLVATLRLPKGVSRPPVVLMTLGNKRYRRGGVYGAQCRPKEAHRLHPGLEPASQEV